MTPPATPTIFAPFCNNIAQKSFTLTVFSLFSLSPRLCPLTPLKLFVSMTCSLLKPTVSFQFSFCLTSQQHWIQRPSPLPPYTFSPWFPGYRVLLHHQWFFLISFGGYFSCPSLTVSAQPLVLSSLSSLFWFC